MKLKRYQSGFTLIELLVIISIIGFLVASVLLYLAQTRGKARDAKRVADVKQISAALDLYLANCGQLYPAEPTGVVLDNTKNLFTSSNNLCGTGTGNGNTNGGIGESPLTFSLTATNNLIVTQFKSAPTPADGSCTETAGAPTGNQYYYTSTASRSGYSLTFCLGRATAGYPAGLNTITR